jgi:hypothetical protein
MQLEGLGKLKKFSDFIGTRPCDLPACSRVLQSTTLPHVLGSIKKKLRGLSPRANYTDRATAACRRSDCQLLRIKGATWFGSIKQIEISPKTLLGI